MTKASGGNLARTPLLFTMSVMGPITMRKTKEYISDVQQKIIELHKLGFKKRARAVKIPISTLRAIIKNFQSTENVMNLPGRGHVSTSS